MKLRNINELRLKPHSQKYNLEALLNFELNLID